MSFELDNFPQPLLWFSVATWLSSRIQWGVSESNQAFSSQISKK